MTRRYANLPLREMRRFLKAIGCEIVRTKGGHELWWREGLTRPLVLQTHIAPVPARIVRSLLSDLEMTIQDLTKILYDC